MLCVLALIPAGMLHAAGEMPKPTLTEDLRQAHCTFRPGYLAEQPRLHAGPADKAALNARAKAYLKLWAPVVKWADEARKDSVTSADIRRGAAYHARPNRIFAAALAGWLTDDDNYRQLACRWMRQYCAEDVWGVGWRENIDLTAAWYCYYLASAYDLLRADLPDEDRSAHA
jgi:hypothetical protein